MMWGPSEVKSQRPKEKDLIMCLMKNKSLCRDVVWPTVCVLMVIEDGSTAGPQVLLVLSAASLRLDNILCSKKGEWMRGLLWRSVFLVSMTCLGEEGLWFL